MRNPKQIKDSPGRIRSTSGGEQSKDTKSMPIAPYCNWGKGNHHNKQCPNPTQCYCMCHSDKVQTDYKLKSERTYCQNRIIAINKILAKRQERVSDLATTSPDTTTAATLIRQRARKGDV